MMEHPMKMDDDAGILPAFQLFFWGQAWDANFEKVYDLAWLVVQRNVASMCPGWANLMRALARNHWYCIIYICIYIYDIIYK